jgi:SSS family solute:Na+ symporter
MVGRFSSIFSYAQDSWALMLAPIMAVFVLAVVWKRMTRPAAVAVLSLAVPMLALVYLRRFYGVLAGFNIFNLSGIVFLLSLVLIVIISLSTSAPETESMRSTLWHLRLVRLPEEETRGGYPWWKKVSFWFLIVVAVFVVIYALFW